jgi:hypothetical protein
MISYKVNTPVRLSKNFYDSEFSCPCCGLFINNDRIVRSVQLLRSILEHPIRITSGTRCKNHNTIVNGTKHSKHMEGKAIDINFFFGISKQEYYEPQGNIYSSYDRLIYEIFSDRFQTPIIVPYFNHVTSLLTHIHIQI